MSRKFVLPNYTVYFDTSTAYSKKPDEPISSKLLNFINQARKLTSLEVRVADVVLEELTYQQFLIAQAAVENLQKNSKTLVDVCSCEAIQIPDASTLEAGARKRLLEIVQNASIAVIEPPISEIDWRKVIQDSCWRRPPFEKPKSPDDLAEKGFRDRIILEAIKADALKIKTGVIALVVHDNLLRTTLQNQVSSGCPIEAYSAFAELTGHLQLLEKTRSTNFAKTVLAKAQAVFYDPNDPNCIAVSKGVIKHLVDEYSEEMSHPSLWQSTPTGAGQSQWGQPQTLTQPLAATPIEEWSNWTPVTPVKTLASPPIFQAMAHDPRYHWTTPVTLVRLLRRTAPARGQGYGAPEERIRTKLVNVDWSCLVDLKTAEFSDISVDNYVPTFHESFVPADFYARAAYNLPLFPGNLSEDDV